MSDLSNEKEAMQVLTDKYVNKLNGIWKKIFHPETCRENLRKLIDHATYFYEELMVESLSRKTFIENEINNLRKEAENLKRLLKTDVELPKYDGNDVPLLIVQSELDKSLEDLREELRLRKEQICNLLLEQEGLCEELDESPQVLLEDPLPTAEEIKNFNKHLENLRREKAERLDKLSALRREIKNFLHILELKVNTEFEDRLINHRQIKVNRQTFEHLERMHSLYGGKARELTEAMQGMRKKLETLWDRLKTSPSARNKINRYNGFNQHTYDILYSEIQRCETLKSQNIKLYVQQIRDEIAKMWEKTLKSEIQKNRFSNFTSTCYTDDLLVLHEMELKDLILFYESNKQIFELFADRNILWERMNALEAKASEPGRYNNRGGHLLKEEKERKTIATKLPKIEQQINELVKKYEEREHTHFLVYGENIIDVMASQWDKKRREKELLQSARKKGKPVNSATKANITVKTPVSLKSASSVSSLRKLALSVPSQKRKLNPTECQSPMAKRSLMQALNSPSVFIKPSTSKGITPYNIKASALTVNKKHNKSASKTPSKKSKLVATTIRRSGGRYSANLKKRRCNQITLSKETPKIVIENCESDGYSTDYNVDDTYDSFQKCIEPSSRSSVIQNINSSGSSSRMNRMHKLLNDENDKLAKLPRPRVVNRTPSKHHISISNLTRTPNHNASATSLSNARKLTTKNLPIIM